jgi:hypothetical protein
MPQIPENDIDPIGLNDDNRSLDTNIEVVIRKYGLLAPLNWDDDCDNELSRQVTLWNRLVEIEEWYRKSFRKITDDNSQMEDIQQKIVVAIANHASFLEENAQILQKKGKSANFYVKQQARDLHAEIIRLKKGESVIRKEARASLRHLTVELELQRRAKVKIARQASGLWWNNYNAVIRSYERGRRMVHRNGGELKPKVFDGVGCFSNQLQGGLTVNKLFEGTSFQIAVRALPENAWTHPKRGERRRLQRTILTATVFVLAGQKRTVSWPMIMHRPIPEDCLIKEAIVTRRAFNSDYKWEVVFTCTRPVQQSNHKICVNPRVSIDLGWRRTAEGLRVATALKYGGPAQFFIIPNDLIRSFQLVEILKEKEFISVQRCVAKLRQLDLIRVSTETQTVISQLFDETRITSRHLKALHTHVNEQKINYHELVDLLENWRKESKLLSIWQANQRRKTINRRAMLYQRYAAEISEMAGTVILQRLNLDRIIRRSTALGLRQLHKNSAYNRNIAAISTLTHWIETQCRKRNIPIVYFIGTPKQVCYHCGSEQSQLELETGNQVCQQCQTHWDTDVGACQAMLAHSTQTETGL